jgi:hypothetical protein
MVPSQNKHTLAHSIGFPKKPQPASRSTNKRFCSTSEREDVSMHAAVVHAATGCTWARTETAKKLSLGGEGDLLRTTLLMRLVGIGRFSGLGDAATAGHAKPAGV